MVTSRSMRGAALCALLVCAALVAVAQAGDVNVGALFTALKYKRSKTSAYLIYQQQDQLALTMAPPQGGPNTVLMPTDQAWYLFFLDYQRGSEYIKLDRGHVAATFPDLTTYSVADFNTLMQGLITYQPPFAKFCVKLLNHMTLPGNVSVASLQKKKKDDLVPNASPYALYITKTHPPTLKSVPSDFDEAQFSQRRAIDPMYIPRMVSRTTSIIEQRVYKGSRLQVHLVDNVLPYINTSWVDPPVPPPPAGNGAAPASALSWSLLALTVVLAAFMTKF